MIDLNISDDVRAVLGEDLALVAPADLPPEPCIDCSKPFDDATTAVSMVVLTGDGMVRIAFAHAACAPSGIRPLPDGYEPPAPDDRMTITALVVDHAGTELPVLVCESAVKAYRLHEQSTDDLVTDFLLDEGFTHVEQLHQAPPTVAEWIAVLFLDHVAPETDGLLILDPRGGIFFQGSLVLPDGWLQQAARHGYVVVYSGNAGLPGLDSDDARTAALAVAAQAGRLVGGRIGFTNAPATA